MGKTKTTAKKASEAGRLAVNKKIAKTKPDEKKEEQPHIILTTEEKIAPAAGEDESSASSSSLSSTPCAPSGAPTEFSFSQGSGYPTGDDLLDGDFDLPKPPLLKISEEAKLLCTSIQAKVQNISAVQIDEDGSGYQCVITIRVFMRYNNVVTEHGRYKMLPKDFTNDIAQILLDSADDGDGNDDILGSYKKLMEVLYEQDEELTARELDVHSATVHFEYLE